MRGNMHINYAHHKTGYLLANPGHFSDIGYEKDIAHLNFSQLKALKNTVQFLKSSKLYAKQLHGTQETELTQLVRQQCCKCDWRAVANARNTDQMNQIMPKKSLVKTVEAAVKTLGIPDIDCAVVATAMAFFAFQKEALDFKKYETNARLTLIRMNWVLEREIASQSCSSVTSIFQQKGLFQKKLDNPVHRERASICLKIDRPLNTTNSDFEFDDLEWEKIEQQIKLANL